MNHLFTQLFTREDDDSHSAEERIAGSVIAMDVRIRHETNRRGAELPDRRKQFVGDLRVLRIDHEDAVRACQHADQTTRSVGMVHIDVR